MKIWLQVAFFACGRTLSAQLLASKCAVFGLKLKPVVWERESNIIYEWFGWGFCCHFAAWFRKIDCELVTCMVFFFQIQLVKVSQTSEIILLPIFFFYDFFRIMWYICSSTFLFIWVLLFSCPERNILPSVIMNNIWSS